MLNKLLALLVVATAHKNDLLEKLKPNLQEVKARGGQMIIFKDEEFDTCPVAIEKQQRHRVGSDKDFKVVKLLQMLVELPPQLPLIFHCSY